MIWGFHVLVEDSSRGECKKNVRKKTNKRFLHLNEGIYPWKHVPRQSNGRADWQVAIKCHSKMMKQGMNVLLFSSAHSRTAISRTNEWNSNFPSNHVSSYLMACDASDIFGNNNFRQTSQGMPLYSCFKCVRKREWERNRKTWMKGFHLWPQTDFFRLSSRRNNIDTSRNAAVRILLIRMECSNQAESNFI